MPAGALDFQLLESRAGSRGSQPRCYDSEEDAAAFYHARLPLPRRGDGRAPRL